ncbi:MAG: tRNA-Thr(GGU) m(6)t(6)A37 methyltransferase TsaA [Pseudohongiellaceae bacterium]
MNTFELNPIGVLHSPFKEKFGIPRQSGLIKSAHAHVEFFPPYNDCNAFKGLEDFSHIWLTFCFHQNNVDKWRPLIRPPRLGGNEKIGVFASRSSFRPNSLGMSVIKLIRVETLDNATRLKIDCPDILDGTPIFDIKPYIHYSDSIENAQCGFAQDIPIATLSVTFAPQSLLSLTRLESEYGKEIKNFIIETLSFDPRPAYHQAQEDNNREYGIRLYDLNIRWRASFGCAEVLSIQQVAAITR